MILKSQNGRSMLEMMFVLAIVGILSLVTFWGYEMAMTRYRANEIIKQMEMFAFHIEQQFEAEVDLIEDFDLLDYQPNGEVNPDIQIAGYAGSFAVDEETTAFEVTLNAVEEEVCERVMASGWEQPFMIYVNNTPEGPCNDANNENEMVFAFNNTLDTETPACNPGAVWNEVSQRCTKCEEDQYQRGGECKPCPAGATAAEGATECACPAGSLWDSGVDEGACVPCPANHYQRDDTCKQCPKGSSSPAGSTECTCPKEPGWNPATEECMPKSCETYADCEATYAECLPEKVCKICRKVAYIQSNGNQYFDMGVKGNQNTKLTVTAASLSNEQIYAHLAGWFSSGSSRSFTLNVNNETYRNGVSRFNGIACTQGNNVFYAVPYQETTYSVSKDGMFKEGNLLQQPWPDYSSFETGGNLYLLRYNSSTINTRPWRLYGAQIEQNGSTIRNFVPVYVDEDSEAAIYDTVEHKIYHNVGTDTEELIVP